MKLPSASYAVSAAYTAWVGAATSTPAQMQRLLFGPCSMAMSTAAGPDAAAATAGNEPSMPAAAAARRRAARPASRQVMPLLAADRQAMPADVGGASQWAVPWPSKNRNEPCTRGGEAGAPSFAPLHSQLRCCRAPAAARTIILRPLRGTPRCQACWQRGVRADPALSAEAVPAAANELLQRLVVCSCCGGNRAQESLQGRRPAMASELSGSPVSRHRRRAPETTCAIAPD